MNRPVLNPDNIPGELRRLDRWVLWRYEERDGKTTKVPVQTSGRMASSTNAATWTSFEAVRGAVGRHGTHGIGIVLTGDGLSGVDFDNCVAPDGTIDADVRELVCRFDTYTERSPSGRGLRLFCYGRKPDGARSKAVVGGRSWEVYETGRYLTVTGDHVGGTPPVVRDCTDALASLCELLARPTGNDAAPVAGDPAPPAEPPPAALSLSDDELLRRAFDARNGAAVRRLWMGDTSAHDGDESAADLALCSHLAFWTGGDALRLDALFRRSGLMRPKWDERRGAQTYGALTISTALRGRTDVYEPKGRTNGTRTNGASGHALHRSDGRAERDLEADDAPPPDLDFKPFPTGALPEAVRDLAREGAAAYECESVMIALPALVVLASAIGNSARLRVKPDWIEPAALWSAIVSPSGTTKSPTLDLALEPAYALERGARSDFERDLADHREAVQAAKRDKTTPPEMPTCRRFRMGDVTTEAVARVLGENPRGVLLARDELAGWFGSFDAYRKSESDLQTWIEFHGGRQTTVDRKTGDRPAQFIERPFVSVTGTVQPGVLARRLTGQHAESGFTARLMLAMPPSSAFGLSDVSVSYAARGRYERLVRGLYDLQPGPDGPELVEVGPEAFRLLKRYADANARRMDAVPEGPVRAVLGKAKMHAVRLALVVHLADAVEAGHDGRLPHAPLTEATMHRAVRLAEWFVREAARVANRLGMEAEAQTPYDRVLDTLAEEFSATEFVDAARRLASLSRSTAYDWLKRLCDGRIERAAHGLYRDVRRTYRPDLALPGLSGLLDYPDYPDFGKPQDATGRGESPESPVVQQVRPSGDGAGAEVQSVQRHALDRTGPTDYDPALNAFI